MKKRVASILQHYRSVHLHTTNLYDNQKPFSCRVSQQHKSSLTLQGVVRSGILLATHFFLLRGGGKSQSPLSLIISSSFFCLSKPCSSTMQVPLGKYVESSPSINIYSFFCAPVSLSWSLMVFIFHLPVSG